MSIRSGGAVALVAACLIALAASGPAAAEGTAPALAPGWWVGAYLTSATSPSGGTVTIHISPTGAASGTIDAKGLAAAVAERRKARLAFGGVLRISGDAGEMLAEGRIKVRGHTKMMGISFPVNLKVTGQGSLRPTSVSCSLATGELDASARLPQQASGYDTNISAKVVLRRFDRKPTAGQARSSARRLSEEFVDAARPVRRFASGRPTTDQLRAALRQIELLLADTAGPGSCAARADTELHQAFALGVLKWLSAKSLSDAELLAALRMSTRLGLLSDEFAGLDAAGLRSAFKQAFVAALDHASDASRARLQVAAVQYGFGGVL